ncbi:MAG: NfeD family protein [Thermodesulfobacteriota bacterium]
MGRSMGSARIVRRYILLQLPGLAAFTLFLIVLESWIVLPGWLFWIAVAAWIVKDVVLYPFVWRAYDVPAAGDHPLVGAAGVANERLDPDGYISIRGELWKAVLSEGSPPVDRGQPVRVIAVDGLTLIVRPGNDPASG